jgi:hypothetical protein
MLLQVPILLFSISSFLEKFTLPCYFKKATGIDCPLCGAQRAFLELLKGNIQKSFLLYPALIPILIMFLYTFLHARFKFKDGAENAKYLFILNVAIIIFSYIYKLINY